MKNIKTVIPKAIHADIGSAMEGQHTTISLCMIVRDEESFIAQAISSVRSIVNQIIVVDTGSTDTTREIATRLGATVIEHLWTGDFAEARNVSLAHATGEWILVLDADEAIDEGQLSLILELTETTNKCYELIQRHYSNDHRLSDYQVVKGEFPAWERSYTGYFESRLVRLFPNHRGIRYVGRIHELVEPAIQKIPDLSVVTSQIRLQHYGHTPEVTARRNKHNLYRELGTAKAAEGPADWKAFFELGVECNKPERREESVNAFQRSLELNPSYLPTWVNLGYVLCELERTTEAIECLASALKLDPKSAEARCNLGVVFLRSNELSKAEAQFREAIRLRPGYINAMMNLYRSLARQGRYPEAILVGENCLQLSPSSASIQGDIGLLYLAGGAPHIARGYLVSALQADPSLVEVRNALCQLPSTSSA